MRVTVHGSNVGNGADIHGLPCLMHMHVYSPKKGKGMMKVGMMEKPKGEPAGWQYGCTWVCAV